MAVKIKCYKYSLTDSPFLQFDANSPDDMIKRLAGLSYHDFQNDIWVEIGGESSLLYDPTLDTFKDWTGVRWAPISNERIIYYFTR